MSRDRFRLEDASPTPHLLQETQSAMARRRLAGKRAIVTGASSGIGREIALRLASQHVDVLVTARREDRLTKLVDDLQAIGVRATYIVGDITDPAIRDKLLTTAQETFNGLDILVNNAGVGAIGPFADANPERLQRILDINFVAPAELIRRAIPLLLTGNQPIIVNISSVLGHRAVPKKSEYCASKFALHGFSDALRAELAADGIDVLLVSPSTTQSEFFDNVLEDNARLPWLKLGGMRADRVALKTVRAIAKGRQEIILTPGGKMLVWCDRLCPPIVNRLVARFG